MGLKSIETCDIAILEVSILSKQRTNQRRAEICSSLATFSARLDFSSLFLRHLKTFVYFILDAKRGNIKNIVVKNIFLSNLFVLYKQIEGGKRGGEEINAQSAIESNIAARVLAGAEFKMLI